ncbi:trypsin-like peptidase domain-containing protein [Isoptericola sp. S6320L]|uniref:trypsin-like peptidase domain-containing protein n=1 Tax=Isoptericola sp. S6320L TaxID=2926411 RepID=UPI001FF5B0AA|nr:trypsin-like peptidase domain-containing protein [Isoptericola sp. S6320L]MCK0118794.1 trypsin-like peptidase domain-containing protein [Isoptericola sp. S6320L]
MSTDNTSPQRPSDGEHPIEQPTEPQPRFQQSHQQPQQGQTERPRSADFAHPSAHQPPYRAADPRAPYGGGTPSYQPGSQQPGPHGAQYQHAPQSQHPAQYQHTQHPQAGHPQGNQSGAPRQRSVWVPVVAAAAGAAVLASGATYALTGPLADDTAASSLAEVGAPEQSEAAPVASSSDQNPDWQAVTAAVAPSVVAIQVTGQSGGSEGSGVVLDAEGHVLTNNHVVAGGSEGTVQVTLSDGRLYEATIVGTDPTTDLAVVQLDDAPDDLEPATFGDSDAVQVGDSVLAVGNPLGLANTATTGIVSALDRPVAASGEGGSEVVVTNAIQIDAAINPGNSGGPLFDAQGRVVGITSSIATLSGGANQSGSIGLGFAIPVNLGTSVADQLIEDGTAEHAFLGVALGDATATADDVTRRGAEIGEVTEGSPAAEAGLQAGDVIVAVDEDSVNGAESLTAYVRERTAGDQATITYVRDGQTQTVDVTFAVREETTGSGSQGGQGEQPGAPGQGQDGQGSDDGTGQGGESSDPTQPDNIPGWLREMFGD